MSVGLPTAPAIATGGRAALRREWCASEPERLPDTARPRFARLHRFLASGRLQVRVLPDAHFGLIHGKAGVITRADGHRTAFLGSVNESRTARRLNYELLWEDDDPQAVDWVQQEFDALWESPFALDLADAVVQDIARIAARVVVPDLDAWQAEPEPAAPIIETPIYRREDGLWAHQKHFVKLAFEAHRGPHGARLVLADQVGLGKTIQLALAAQLMALAGSRPVLILAPKPLIWQWQREMASLLDMPSAVWSGNAWWDEHGVEHPAAGAADIRRCPRRVGIVSTGLVTAGAEAAEGPDYTALRRALRLPDTECCADGGSFQRLSAPDRARVRRVFPRFLEHANPFIRHNEHCWSASLRPWPRIRSRIRSCMRCAACC